MIKKSEQRLLTEAELLDLRDWLLERRRKEGIADMKLDGASLTDQCMLMYHQERLMECKHKRDVEQWAKGILRGRQTFGRIS